MKINHHVSVWKIGSRWSENGDINRKIFCLFKESHCVFFGDNQNHTTSHINTYKDKIKKNDFLLIADGLNIIALAQIISSGDYIQNLEDIPHDVFEINKSAFDYNWETNNKNAFGWKVNLRYPNDGIIVQKKIKIGRQRIYKMHKYADDVIDIFNNFSHT